MKDHQDRIGQQIGGYRLLRLLGRGSFGAVYLAQSAPQQQPVALKLLQMPLSGREEFKSFLNEARTMRLQHPHIVPLFDFGTSREDLPYLVMEYLPGGTLRDRYPRGTRLPLDVACHYISQLASALQYAHEQRIIHRDVKPENMLLRTDDTVLLSDFGIASAIEQSTASASMVNTAGTPAYIAPEQSHGKPQPASDQYALAVVAYEWLSGNRLFTGTPTEIVIQHRLDTPPPLSTHRQDLPIAVDQVIARALAKQPEERFATIEQFAQALHAASQPASRTSNLFKPAAPMPPLSAPLAPSPALSQPMAMPSQAEITPMPGRDTPIPLQPTPAFDGRASSQFMPGRGPAAAPQAHQFTAYGAPASRPLPNEQPMPLSLAGNPYAVPMQPPELRRPIAPWQKMVMAALVLLIIAGGLLAYSALRTPTATQRTAHQATPNPLVQQATATTQSMQTATARAQATVQVQATSQARIIAAAQAQGKPQLLWTVTTGGPIWSSPNVVNGVAYVGSNDYKLYAINTVTGQQEWTFATAGNLHYLPTVVDGVVYLTSEDSHLYAIDTTTGQLKWAFGTKAGISAAPVVANGIVYIGSGDGHLYAIDTTTGQQKWVFAPGGPIWGSPIVANGVVYFGSIDDKLYAINATTGQLKWAFVAASYFAVAPTIANGVVYAGSLDDKLYAIDAATGQQKWALPTGGPVWSPPTIANGVVYVGSHDYKLYAIDAATGLQKWAFTTGGKVWSSPTVVNGAVYVGSMDHKLYAINAATGQLNWAFTTGDAIQYSSPTVVNGVVYIGSMDHKLYAIAV